jgi:hypothetical protein
MVGIASKIRLGDPLEEDTQMGPLATTGQLAHIEKQVALAQEQGGKLLHGGRRPPGMNNGLFYEPTIIECPDQKMDIVDTELFGPVLSVLRFREEDEVVRLGQRHQARAGRGRVHPEWCAGLAGDEAAACRDRVGEHLPCCVSDCRVRRVQVVGLRARKRHAGDL